MKNFFAKFIYGLFVGPPPKSKGPCKCGKPATYMIASTNGHSESMCDACYKRFADLKEALKEDYRQILARY